jgi:TRAP-type C4-dicarboxylate transport system permease small subunit
VNFIRLARGFISVVTSLVHWLTTGGGVLSAVGILAITLMVTGDVAARFLAGAGTKWTLEFTGYILVLVVFFGLAYTLRERSHIRILFLVDRLPKKVQIWLEVVTSFIFLGFTAFLCYLTWNATLTSIGFGTTSRTGVDVLVWPYQLFMPLGLALISILLIGNIYTRIRDNIRGVSPSAVSEEGESV